MADRNVLIIEADGAFAAELRGALEPYGFGVQVTADGNEVLQRPREPMPDLVLLCVEPKNVGYAICNKLKKNNAWKSTPIVLMSSEATQDTFDQHRKLKTHADEYLIKPFAIEDLLQKVDQLIGLGDLVTSGPSDDSLEISLDTSESVEEIALEEDELAIVDDEATALGGSHPVAEEATTITLDDNMDPESEAAFASLTGGHRGVPMPEAEPQGARAAGATLQGGYQAMREPEPFRGRTGTPPATTEPMRAAAAAEGASREALDVGLDQVAAQPSAPRLGLVGVSGPQKIDDSARDLRGDAYTTELQQRLRQLEEERDRLKREVEDARRLPRAEIQAFSREREFLNLREIINKKEKEILDLKDDLDSKDRQILDHKDKIRELERKGRDLEEKSLNFEQQLLGEHERVAGLVHELENVRQRATDERTAAARELERTRAEARAQLAQNDEEHAQERARLEGEHERGQARLRGEHEKAMAALREEHAGEIAALHEAHEAALAERDAHLGHTIEEAQKHEQEAMAAAEQRRQAELMEADDKRKADLQAADERRQRELAVQAEEHRTELGRLAEEHRGAMEQKAREHEMATAAAREEAETRLGQAQEKHRAAEEESAARHRREIEELTEKFDVETAELKRKHAAELDEQEQSHRDLKLGMEQRHKAQTEELRSKHATEAAALSDELAQRDQALEAARGQIARLESELGQATTRGDDLDGRLKQAETDLVARDGRIGEHTRRIEDLERENSGFQDQVLKAFTKIRKDGQLAEKARRALAIAAALLEEQNVAPADGENRGSEESQA